MKDDNIVYVKTRRNFPDARQVTAEQRLLLGKTFLEIGKQYSMTIGLIKAIRKQLNKGDGDHVHVIIRERKQENP